MVNLSNDLRKRAVMTFIVVFVAVQVVVATVALFGPRPARWSWQMYSGGRPQVDFVIVRDNGTRDAVEIADYVSNRRAEIDYAEVLPAYLCQVETDAASITITPADTPATEVRCEP